MQVECRKWLATALSVASALSAATMMPTQSYAQSGPAVYSTIRTSGFKLTEQVAVDATEAPRKIFHSRMTIPATPGDFVVTYPKWIPGEHGPTGPVADTAGIYFRAAGQTLEWRRDPVDMYAFHVKVPAGVKQIEATIDFLSPVEMPGGFSAGSSATDKLAVLAWNWLVFYPKGQGSDEVGVEASLKLPAGWKWASALPQNMAPSAEATTVQFKPASLTTLVDSPVLMGEYLKKIKLDEGVTPAHELDIAADSAAELAMKPEQKQAFDNLVAEAGALYASRHYRHYNFLLTLSNHVAHFGLEHHESNDSRTDEKYLIDANQWVLGSSLLPHEYTHSWNGKYRRPAGLATANYSEPMDGSMLWVYEGLTEYFGYVLTARSGLETPEQWRDELANLAMTFSHRPGRNWRALEDTATAAQTLYDSGQAFSNYRRSVDYYDEGALIWLEADTIIRQQSHGKKSMDDFAHLFHGGADTAPAVKTYTFDDVVRTMNAVVPYDWRGFFTARVLKVAPVAPLNGLANSGWKLAYTAQPNSIDKIRQQAERAYDASASLGLVVTKTGAVADAIEGSIAARHGIGPGMKIVAVNGRKYTTERLEAALQEGQNEHQPLQLLVENTEYYRSVTLDYFDGPRYAHLVRDESKPDLLTPIISPKVTKLPKPFTDEN